MSLREAIKEESKWTKTWNGADALKTTDNPLVDMFGRAGSMRDCSEDEKNIMISQAYNFDADAAMKLLFYTRDIRGGYGERDTFNTMLRHVANINPASVEKNLWAVIEFGRAKDLYSLIGTKAEDAMWRFMKEQFELDYENMKAGKQISLLAKWIATPDASSPVTSKLGKLTAKKLGYDFKNMRTYKTKLRELRKYLDIPESKVAAKAWSEIEYSRCASRFLFKYKNAILKNDGERWEKYLSDVNNGTTTMNTSTLTPCDIVHKYMPRIDRFISRADSGIYIDDSLETMWNNLPNVCKGNTMVLADVSSSMYSGCGALKPIDVSVALAIYISQRNEGDLKNMFMTFETDPKFVEINGATLLDNLKITADASWGGSTDLKKAFKKLLETCVKGNVKAEEMPDAIIVISDMQINCSCIKGYDSVNKKLLFYDEIKADYEAAGYKMPHLVFWNVNASNPTFHSSADEAGVSLVSGYSQNVYKQVMENLGTTPIEFLYKVLNDERYKDIVA